MNVGILGCGVIADFHLPHILKQPGVSQVHLVDLDRDRAEATAQRYGVKSVFPDLSAMLSEVKIDIVHVLTPPSTHARLAIQAMDAGCHVLVEKPMALSAAEAEAMVTSARHNSVKLAVDHNFLLSPIMRQVASLVHSGQVGRLTHVEANYSFDIRRSAHLNRTVRGQINWAFRLPAGPLEDHLPHPASLLIDLLSEVQKVWAISKNGGILPDGLPDELRVLVDSKDATGLLSVSFGTKPDTILVNVYGTEMTVHANLSNMTLAVRKNNKVPKKLLRAVDGIGQSTQMLSGTFSNALKVLRKRAGPPGDVGPVIAMFYESIASGGDTPISGEAGLRVTGFIEEVRKQIKGPEKAWDRAQSTESLSLESQEREAHPKILVTGGTGFLGSHLVGRLVQEGHEVRVLARKMSRLDHLPKMGIQVVYGDLRDEESLCQAMQGIEVVYHAAAAMGGSWEDFEDGTIRGTERLLELSLAAGVKRFIHISSLSVYEAAGYKRNSVIEESSPYPKDPLKVGPYSYSKVEAEKLAFEYYKKGLPVAVVRPGLVYGPRGKIMFPHVGYSLGGKLFMMVGLGSNLLPFTYIDNTIDAILLASECDLAVGEVYTIVDDGEMTQKEYLKLFVKATGAQLRVLPVPYSLFLLPITILEVMGKMGIIKKKHLPSRYSMASKYNSLRYSSEKAKRELNWQPRVSLEEGMQKTFDWYNQAIQRRRPI